MVIATSGRSFSTWLFVLNVANFVVLPFCWAHVLREHLNERTAEGLTMRCS
jgi:hypothetical protein